MNKKQLTGKIATRAQASKAEKTPNINYLELDNTL